MTTPKGQLQTLSRALDVLEAIEASAQPVTLTEIARQLGEVAPVVLRVLQTLEARGYVRRRPEDKRYTHTGRSTGSGAIRRAMALLRSMSSLGFQGGSLEELARQTGFDEGSITELLDPLLEAGVIELDHSGGRWRISYGLMELVRPLLAGDSLMHIVRPLMERLQAETEETVSLFYRAGERQIVAAAIPSHQPVRYVLDVGTVFPLYRGAAGKAALAALTDSDVEAVLAQADQQHLPDAEQLRREIETTRARGYAMSSGERVEGASAVATAIRDAAGIPRAVLGLMMPSFRISPDKLHALGSLLAREVGALHIPPLPNGHEQNPPSRPTA